MCHDRWMRRDKRREELDEELHYLLDEERRGFEPPAPMVEHQRDSAPEEPERLRVEAGLRS